jgi:hypothetical protein
MVLALAMAFLEARLIFSMDWSVYQSPANGLIRYSLRLLIALSAFAVALMEIINLKLKYNEISSMLIYAELGLLLGAIPVCVFGANYIGLVYGVFAVLLFGLSFLLKRVNKAKKD